MHPQPVYGDQVSRVSQLLDHQIVHLFIAAFAAVLDAVNPGSDREGLPRGHREREDKRHAVAGVRRIGDHFEIGRGQAERVLAAGATESQDGQAHERQTENPSRRAHHLRTIDRLAVPASSR